LKIQLNIIAIVIRVTIIIIFATTALIRYYTKTIKPMLKKSTHINLLITIM